MILVLSPHNDDETLFAAFTVLRHAAHVVVCHGSAGDYGGSEERMQESAQAVATLGGTLEQWRVPSGDADLLHSKLVSLREARRPTRVFVPDAACSHPDHRLLAEAGRDVFRGRGTTYHTYTLGALNQPVKVRSESEAPLLSPSWAHRKLRALASYQSQATHRAAHQFFMQDLWEYYGEEF